MRVETVIQIRSCESRKTKFTFPIGSPSMLSARTLVAPSRVMSSRQSVPKLEIRMSHPAPPKYTRGAEDRCQCIESPTYQEQIPGPDSRSCEFGYRLLCIGI